MRVRMFPCPGPPLLYSDGGIDVYSSESITAKSVLDDSLDATGVGDSSISRKWFAGVSGGEGQSGAWGVGVGLCAGSGVVEVWGWGGWRGVL